MTTGHQCIIIATYSDAICVKITVNLTKTLRTTYDWSIDRMNELCTDGDIEQLKDAVSIRQEFAEWLLREDKDIKHNIISLEYMGEGSDYDI